MSAVATSQDYGTLVRDLQPDERNFVLDSWVKSYQGIMPPFARTYGQSRWDWTERCAHWGLDTSKTTVVCLAEASDIILGWACGGPHVLHYVYVKRAARRQGLARELLQGLGVGRGARMTHRPASGLRIHANERGYHWQPLTLQEIST